MPDDPYISANKLGGDAIKAAFLINAGAATAILTFMAATLENPKPFPPDLFAVSLALYALGAGAAAVGWGFAFLSAHAYAGNKKGPGDWWFVLTVVVVGVAFAAFGIGGYVAYEGMRGHAGAATTHLEDNSG